VCTQHEGDLAFDCRVEGGFVRVSGEVDLNTAPSFHDVLMKCVRDTGHLPTVDLSGVTYFDSCGIQALIDAKGKQTEARETPRIIGVRPHVLRVLHLVGLDKLFQIQGSDEPDARPY